MLKLSQPIKFNAYMSPICLPEQGQELATGSTLYTTGWGQTNGRIQNSFSTVLRQATISIQQSSRCGRISDTQICAGKMLIN
jgi:hypothetical protein